MARSKLRFFVVAGFLTLLAVSSLYAAPPTLTALFPAGAQQGQTVEVTALGAFDRWPTRPWVDGPGIEITASKDKGKLSISVAADTPAGMYWIRLSDESGASALRPFFVGTLPEVLEKEPNDDFKKAQVVDTDVVINGKLNQTGDVDCFAQKLRKGQTLVASVEANRRLGSPMDSILQVVSADGFVLDQNNDFHDLDPQIIFVAPADGVYIIRLFAFPATPDSSIRFAGGDAFIYRLTLTTGGFVEYAYPLATDRANPGHVELCGWNIPEAARKVVVGRPDGLNAINLSHSLVANSTTIRAETYPTIVEAEPNDRQHPQPIVLPVSISGRIDPPGNIDVYQFQAKKGQKVQFQVESRALGYPLDGVLRLTDAAGKTLTQVDDPGSRRDPTRDPDLSYTIPEDGTYRIEVRDLHSEGGYRYVYRLRAFSPEPDYDLTLANDRFVLQPGKTLDIPITIDRRNGHNQEIEINAVGLPEALSPKPIKAAGSAKTASLRLTAPNGPLAVPFQIVGKIADQPDSNRTARTPIAGLTAVTPQLWLNVLKPGAEPEKAAPEKKKKR